jgi:radical SAM protein with 4Fe4S-binding SPASM domain
MSAAASKPYRKQHSFESFFSRLDTDPAAEKQRALSAIRTVLDGASEAARPDNYVTILQRAYDDLTEGTASGFCITTFIADELARTMDENLPQYIYHRYRYDIFPKTRELDDYPPYIQIEPSSVCNFRCVFCYQTDSFFASRKSGQMGKMSIDLFRQVVDAASGHVAFGSLASRGEPLINNDINEMLDYCRDKFLGLKLNTNASLLTEAHAHAILSGGVKTLVFSADAAEEPTYSEFRVNGSLDETLRNVSMFQRVREQHYPKSKLITRVSGVMIDDGRQKMESMVSFWGDYVDQVSFVQYNPWENIYETPPTNISAPCSDLWRRMFVWLDGVVNPCDTDYRSTLAIGNLAGRSLTDLWRAPAYEELRQRHEQQQRGELEPCRRCSVV